MDQLSDRLSDLQLAYDRLSAQASIQAAFLGTASHELRAPINQIISLHQLILEGLCESPEEEREFLEQANQAIYQVLHNLDLLINLSKLDIGSLAPKPRPCPISEILAEVKQLNDMKCVNHQCRLNLEPIDPGLTVLTDPQWLRQALMVLVEGALAAGSTQITLAVGDDQQDILMLKMHCNCSITAWQVEKSAVAVMPSEVTATSETIPTTKLSPQFCDYLAQRITHHLHHGYQLAAAVDNTTQCQMVLPTGE